MELSTQLERILIVGITPYFLEKGSVWFEENLAKIFQTENPDFSGVSARTYLMRFSWLIIQYKYTMATMMVSIERIARGNSFPQSGGGAGS